MSNVHSQLTDDPRDEILDLSDGLVSWSLICMLENELALPMWGQVWDAVADRIICKQREA